MNSPVTDRQFESALPLGDVTLANARLVLEDQVLHGQITVSQGEIVEIAEGDQVPAGAVDCREDCVIPGLVELHTDNLERHMEPRPKVNWPHNAAILAHDAELASVGITTVFDALRVGSIHSGVKEGGYGKYAREVASRIIDLRAASALKISHFIHLRAEVCSETLAAEFEEFTADDRIGLVSMMDHTPGQRQFRDLKSLYNYITKKRGMTDAQFEEHVANLHKLRATYGEVHEQATLKAAERLGAVLASHDDTTREQVETSARYGIKLAEFPTTVEGAQACRDNGIAIMMGAPNLIRGGSHSGNVSALDLAERGLLDIISSDYVPSALVLSAFKLAAVWDDLPRAIATVTATPAKATALLDRGTLSMGKRGDLIRVSQTGETPIIRGVWSQGRQVG